MKKAVTTIAALAIAASVCATGGVAAGRNFRDNNRDGICDNRTALCTDGSCSNRCTGFVDADGDGVCDNRIESWCGGRGTGFVDDDADGVCDNRAARRGQRWGGCRRG